MRIDIETINKELDKEIERLWLTTIRYGVTTSKKDYWRD